MSLQHSYSLNYESEIPNKSCIHFWNNILHKDILTDNRISIKYCILCGDYNIQSKKVLNDNEKKELVYEAHLLIKSWGILN